MPKRKRLTYLIIIFILVILYFANVAREFVFTPLVSKKNPTAIRVNPNQDVRVLCQKLYQRNLIHHPWLFEAMIYAKGKPLRYGEYEISYPLTAWKLLNNMTKGIGLLKHRLTIVEGWTMDDIRAALARDPDLIHTVANQKGEAVLQKLKDPNKKAEGLFYPDTYFFTWGNSDFVILKMAYQKMQRKLNQAWQNRAPNLPYQSPYDALIVASIIERETPNSPEKPLVSSVILNRLAKNMRLQVDPTVQYGLNKKFNDDLTKKDLDAKNPYNTYLNFGLPPTPICMPSASSINAALHPAQTNYFYYVSNGKGGLTFSATFVEHEKAVAVYRNQKPNVAIPLTRKPHDNAGQVGIKP